MKNKFNSSTQLQFCFFLLCAIATSSCKTTQATRSNSTPTLSDQIAKETIFANNFSGILLQEANTEKVLFQQYPDHRFTPASTIKILTLYAALEILGQEIPALHYTSSGDTLLLWGTGDPGFLHPNLNNNNLVLDFLKTRKETTFLFSNKNFHDDRFGAGWAWDDYTYGYQTEKSPWPIYGNKATFIKKAGEKIEVFPNYFNDKLRPIPTQQRGILRHEFDNTFTYHPPALSNNFSLNRPFHFTPDLLTILLTDTLGKRIATDPLNRPLPENHQTLNRPLNDDLFRLLMQDSDNFIAEQLLLTTGGILSDSLQTKKAIEQLKKIHFSEMASTIRWVDGSGLSRYNLLTPRSVTWVLEKLYQKIPQERLLNIFPTGGKTGTIANWYGGQEKPYVFAKTGSLSGVHCLSGYVKTKKGKTLIFSFMHNGFIGSANEYREAMERVLEFIYNEVD